MAYSLRPPTPALAAQRELHASSRGVAATPWQVGADVASKVRELLEATFYQTHVAETRTITEEHIWKAALNLAGGMKTDDWVRAEKRMRDGDYASIVASLSPAWRAAVDDICSRVRQDKLPLISMQTATPLKAQVTHLSFQEYFTARALCTAAATSRSAHVWRRGESLLVPWQLPEWWANTMRLGEEMGIDFAHGLLKAAGKTGSEHLDLRAQLSGLTRWQPEPTAKRSIAFSAISMMMRVVPSLDLRDNRLSTAEARVVIQGMLTAKTASTAPTAIRLAGNRLGASGDGIVLEMADAVTSGLLDSLRHVDLARTRLCGRDELGRGKYDKTGLTELAASFRKCSALVELNLCDNQLGDDGGSLVLEELARAYAKVPIQLTTLNLAKNSLCRKACAPLSRLVSKARTLTALDVSENSLDAECATILGGVIGRSRLQLIDFTSNRLCQGRSKRLESDEAPGRWCPKENPSEPFATSHTPEEGGNFSGYVWTAEGIYAIAQSVSDAPWKVHLKLDDNCLCGMVNMYLDDWTPRGAYTDLAFTALVEVFKATTTTSNLSVSVERNMAAPSDMDMLLEALQLISVKKKAVRPSALDEDANAGEDADPESPTPLTKEAAAATASTASAAAGKKASQSAAETAAKSSAHQGGKKPSRDAIATLTDAPASSVATVAEGPTSEEKATSAAAKVGEVASAMAASAGGDDQADEKTSVGASMAGATDPAGAEAGGMTVKAELASVEPVATEAGNKAGAGPGKQKQAAAKRKGAVAEQGSFVKDEKKPPAGKGKKGAKAEPASAPAPPPAPEEPKGPPPPEPMQNTSVLKVRSDCDPKSDLVMNLPKGSIVLVVQTEQQSDGSIRGQIKFPESTEPLGWITTTKADGTSPLVSGKGAVAKDDAASGQKDGDATFELTKAQQVYKTNSVLKVRKECDPKSDLVEGLKSGNLPKGTEVYVKQREPQSDKSERSLVQLTDQKEPLGWITTIKTDGTQNLAAVKTEVETTAAAPVTGISAGKDGDGATKKKAYVKPKVELTKAQVNAEKVLELNRKMKPTLDKNGLIVYPGAIKRKVDQKEAQKSRHEEAPPLDVDDGVTLMFNLHLAPFKVAIGDGDAVPESDTYMIYARNGKSIGKVKIPPTKGQPLEERVVFNNAWLLGDPYGVVHHAQQGSGSIEVSIKIDDKNSIVLIASPWLAYGCSLGARFLLRRFGETQGRIGTVKRMMNDDRIVLHIDGTDAKDMSALVTIDARPDSVVKSSLVRHPVGTSLFLLHMTGSTPTCVDAVVAEMPMDKWKDGEQLVDENGFRIPDGVHGSRHWMKLKVSGATVEADLNEFNHAVQRFASKDEYEKMRVDHCQVIVEKNAQVEDAITGNTLFIKDQLVKVDVKASTQGATNKLLGRAVDDVSTLVDILLTAAPRRISGEYPAQPLLMRAGPGTGKTWMCKQAVWMLADKLQHTNDWKGVRLIPLVMFVQQIIYILRDVNDADREGIRGRVLMDKYVQEVHSKHAEMLKQAWDLRALIVILDGVDEAAGMRPLIEDFVLNSLVASGNRVMITSRIEGIANLAPYQATNFSVLDLKELSNEQQRIVIRTQMDGNEFFDHLLALGELRRGMETAYISLKESSRTMLESLYMKPPKDRATDASDDASANQATRTEGAPGGEIQPADAEAPAAASLPELEPELQWGVLEELLKVAISESFDWSESLEANTEDAGEQEEDTGQKDTATRLKQFKIEEIERDDDTKPLHARVHSKSGKMVYYFVYRLLGLLDEDAEPVPVEIEFDDGTQASLTAKHLLNRFIDLDPAHYRYALCTMQMVSGSTVIEAAIEIHMTDVLKANMASVATSGESGADHYNYFKLQLVGKVPTGRTTALTIEEIDSMLEPALVFLVDASGVPVLLSLLVLIFSSGGDDLSDLPTNQYQLYSMGIHHAINKRLLSIYSPYIDKPADGGRVFYNDQQATYTVIAIWQQIFALNTQNSEKLIQEVARGAVESEGEGKGKGSSGDKKGLGIENEKGSSDVIKASAQLGSDEMLYELLKHGAHYLNVATHGGNRTVLNKIELTIAKNIRTIVMTLVEANLKLIRDSKSINTVGLTMLRNVAVSNQLAGRRHFGARDVATCLLKEQPYAEALTLWLHLDAMDDGPPLVKALERQTEDAEGQYQFKHLSFQEGLFAQYLFNEAAEGKWDGWLSDESAAIFLNDPFMNNTCRIASMRFGALLGKQRPFWNFATEKSRLRSQGKRAMWLLSNAELTGLDLTNNEVGEDFDEAGDGLGRLVGIATTLNTLRLADNFLGKLDWRKQQFTRALSGSESLTELNVRNNGLEEKGVRMVCNALQTCKSLRTLDLSFNRPFREPALPSLLRMHPSLTDVGVIEEGKGKLDSRAKIIIGQALTERRDPKMFAMQNDIFQVYTDTTSIDWPVTAEYGDVLMLAGIIQTNTTLTSFKFRSENLNDDDQETLGRAMLKHRAGRIGYCSNFGLHEPKAASPEPNKTTGPKAGAVAAASRAPAGKGKEDSKKAGEKDKEKAAPSEEKALREVSYDLKDREVIRSSRSFVLLAGIIKANQVVKVLTLKSLELIHVADLGAALRCNDTLKQLRLVRERGHVVTLDVQQLTGRAPKEKINLCPSLGIGGGASADAAKYAPTDGRPDVEPDERELVDRVCVSIVGNLLMENQVVETLRLNPGKGTDGGMAVEFLDMTKSSSLRHLDLNGVKLGDRGAPELFGRLRMGMCSMLTMLSLRSNTLNDNNLELMVAALAREHCALTKLDLSDNPSISSELLLKALMGNRTLTSLDLMGCPKLTEDVDKIGLFLGHEMCSCPVGFIRINLPSDGSTGSAPPPARAGDEAGGPEVTSEAPPATEPPVAEAKKEVKKDGKSKANMSSEVFAITENDSEVTISNPSALDLFVGLLRWNRLIRKVNLSSVLVENAKAIEFALKTNEVLEELDISHNSLHAERDILAIIDGVTSSASLKLIALDGKALPIDQLRGEEAQRLADFADYSLNILSARVIASLLSDNSALVQLLLQSNHLCAVGAEAIATSLAHSPARETLKVLDLSRNNIGGTASTEHTGGREGVLASIFVALGDLKKLEHLLLDENELETIACLHQLKNMRKLSLKGNRLRSLPNEMGILKALQDLVLQDNRLTRLPRHIDGLKGIQRLDLKANDLAVLPDSIGNLASLKTLDISDNRRLVELPRSIYNLSKELNLIISPAMRGLSSPPYAAVKGGIAEMRKWWDATPAEDKAADQGGGAWVASEWLEGDQNDGSSSLPGRVTKRRPIRNRGEPSRHVWAESEYEPVLIINFFNGEFDEIVADKASVPFESEAQIFMVNDEVGAFREPAVADQPTADRIKLYNTWQRAEVVMDARLGFATRSPTMNMTVDWHVATCGHVQMMPHLGYACALGMRLELRQPVYQVDVQKTTYTRQAYAGCATVIDVLGSDVVRVRFDNSDFTLDLDASPSVVTTTALPSFFVKEKSGTADQIQPASLMLLQDGKCVDAVVMTKVDGNQGNATPVGGSTGQRYRLKIARSLEEDGDEVEMDLNRYNHALLQHFSGVNEYEVARRNYCNILMREYSTVLEVYSNIANVPTKFQSADIELMQEPSFVPKAFADEIAEELTAARRKGRDKEYKTPQEIVIEQVSSMKSLKDMIEMLVVEPLEERTRGAHWAIPLQLCSFGSSGAELGWLLNCTAYSLARRLGDPRLLTDGMQLVPFVISTFQLEMFVGRTDEENKAALRMLHEGQVLRTLITKHSVTEEEHRQVLLYRCVSRHLVPGSIHALTSGCYPRL